MPWRYDLALIGIIQTNDAAGDGRLAGTAFAHHAERLTTAKLEIDIIGCHHTPFFGTQAEKAAAASIGLFETSHLQHRL